MKRMLMAILLLLGVFVTGSVFAQTCPGGTTRVISGTPASPNSGAGDFLTFITNATSCAARGGGRWQEVHATNLDLIDWKFGSTSTMDPTKKVGTWSATTGASATVTHTYGSTSYTWAICQVGTALTYTLVSPTAGTVTGATVLAGQVACP